ncbi:hypothetical protein [Aeromonas enteropelogenes]|uniref:hypothetical protein n=1 Tax=Aeromonas enteropelogenes TaxID=29489 RepID=UPI003134A497
MKYISFLLLSLTLIGCSSTNRYDDEHMYDLASQFKDLAQSVDGMVKFGDLTTKNGDQILTQVFQESPEKAKPFEMYTIKVELQGDNAILLLCNKDVALIEDAGCNAELDKVHWKTPTHQSCSFTIDSIPLCK